MEKSRTLSIYGQDAQNDSQLPQRPLVFQSEICLGTQAGSFRRRSEVTEIYLISWPGCDFMLSIVEQLLAHKASLISSTFGLEGSKVSGFADKKNTQHKQPKQRSN